MQTAHSEEKWHKCALCTEGRFFKTKALLDRHMKYHSEPEHECGQCGKKCYTSNELSQHMKYHSGPAHECKQCGKKFHTSGGLKRHEKVHLS